MVVATREVPSNAEIEEMHENFNRLYPMSESTERCIVNCFKNLQLELVEYGSPKFLYLAWRETIDKNKIQEKRKRLRSKDSQFDSKRCILDED